MAKFKDKTGAEWNVEVTVDTVKRVKSEAKFDLMTLVSGESEVNRLATDPVLLAETLYAVIKPDAEKKSLSLDDFCKLLTGDALDDATTALLEGLADFFPAPRRALMMKAIVKIKEVEKAIMEAGTQKLDALNVDDLIRQTESGAKSTDAPSSQA